MRGQARLIVAIDGVRPRLSPLPFPSQRLVEISPDLRPHVTQGGFLTPGGRAALLGDFDLAEQLPAEQVLRVEDQGLLERGGRGLRLPAAILGLGQAIKHFGRWAVARQGGRKRGRRIVVAPQGHVIQARQVEHLLRFFAGRISLGQRLHAFQRALRLAEAAIDGGRLADRLPIGRIVTGGAMQIIRGHGRAAVASLIGVAGGQ